MNKMFKIVAISALLVSLMAADAFALCRVRGGRFHLIGRPHFRSCCRALAFLAAMLLAIPAMAQQCNVGPTVSQQNLSLGRGAVRTNNVQLPPQMLPGFDQADPAVQQLKMETQSLLNEVRQLKDAVNNDQARRRMNSNSPLNPGQMQAGKQPPRQMAPVKQAPLYRIKKPGDSILALTNPRPPKSTLAGLTR